MKTISQFFEDAYAAHIASAHTDSGTWTMYRNAPATGRLTRVDFRKYPTTPLTDDYLLVFGWLSEEPAGVEDLVTLAANGVISLYGPGSFKATSEVAPAPAPKAQPADPITESRDIAARAHAATVIDAASFALAGELVKDIKRVAREVGKVFDPIVEKAHQAHKEAIAQRDQFLAPLVSAEKYVKAEMSDWHTAEQRRIDAENRKREEARQQAEREAAEAAEAERQELIAQAEEHGDESMANELINAVLTVTPVVPVFNKLEAPRVAGISTRTAYHADVTDIVSLIRAAAAQPEIYADCLMPNMSRLNLLARESAGDGYQIPGVRFVAEQKMAVRA